MPKNTKSGKAAASRVGGAELVVSAQQSRFHADAIDAPDSKEVRPNSGKCSFELILKENRLMSKI